jgi:hypothetical protein
MNELDTALSVAERYVPDSKKSDFHSINSPLSKLEYAMKFMPHGCHYESPFWLRPEDAEAFELVNDARLSLLT